MIKSLRQTVDTATLIPCFWDYQFLCYAVVIEGGKGFDFLDKVPSNLSVPKELKMDNKKLDRILANQFWTGDQIKAYFEALGKEVSAYIQNSGGKIAMAFVSEKFLAKVALHNDRKDNGN